MPRSFTALSLLSLIALISFQARADFEHDFAVEEAPAGSQEVAPTPNSSNGKTEDYVLESGDRDTEKLVESGGAALPSKEDTLAAIKKIYETQKWCTRPTINDADTNNATRNEFQFSWTETHVTFKYTRSYSGKTQTIWREEKITFNPDDTDISFEPDSDLISRTLRIACRGGEDCLEVVIDGMSGFRPSDKILFCHDKSVDRIRKALGHLATFYRSAKRLPF